MDMCVCVYMFKHASHIFGRELKRRKHWVTPREGNLEAGRKGKRKMFHCIPFGVF